MYHPGDHKVICDLCGLEYLRSQCRKNWKGQLVCSNGCWESRHPQDFVRGTKDDIKVDDPRSDVSYAIGETTIKTSACIQATSIELSSLQGITQYDGVSITMDDGVVHGSFITGVPVGTTIVINDPLPKAATAGNAVFLPSVSGVTFLATTEITKDSF